VGERGIAKVPLGSFQRAARRRGDDGKILGATGDGPDFNPISTPGDVCLTG
jgi:hypothetical protein